MVPAYKEGLMDFEDLVVALVPPERRAGRCDDEMEHHFSEGAVMIAYAMHLLRRGATDIRIHPDGERDKQFDFTDWLHRQGFQKVAAIRKTAYGGIYRDGDGRETHNRR